MNLRLFPRKSRATLRNAFHFWKPGSQTRAHLSYSRPRPTALRVCIHRAMHLHAHAHVHVTRTRTRGWGGQSPAAAAHDRTGRCQHVCARSDVPGSSRRAHLEEEVAAREQQPARRRDTCARPAADARMQLWKKLSQAPASAARLLQACSTRRSPRRPCRACSTCTCTRSTTP